MVTHRKTKKPKEEDPYVEAERPRIPKGKYEAFCYATETGVRWAGRRDLYVKFRIFGGDYDGTEIFMVCPFPQGKIRQTRKFVDQWKLATGRATLGKRRLGANVFPNKLYRVLVRDTERRFPDGTMMPSHLQYSVVDTIVERLTGGEYD